MLCFFFFLVSLSITIATLNNIQPSFTLHKNWHPNLTLCFATSFHILSCFRYIMIFTLIDTSMDRTSMCMPPAPLPTRSCHFLVPLLTHDLLTPNPKPCPLGKWLPCPCCWGKAVAFPCLSSVSSLATSSYLPETWSLSISCEAWVHFLPYPCLSFHFGWILGVMEGKCVHLHDTVILEFMF